LYLSQAGILAQSSQPRPVNIPEQYFVLDPVACQVTILDRLVAISI